MTSCGMEAFNALWSALGFLAPCALLGVYMRRCLTEDWNSSPGFAMGFFVSIMVLGSLSWGAHYNGQNGVRYLHASSAGYDCQHDGSRTVTIIRGGN